MKYNFSNPLISSSCSMSLLETESNLNFLKQYYDRMGHFRPVVLKFKSINPSKIEDLLPLLEEVKRLYGFKELCEYCYYQDCCCKNRVKCDICGKKVPMEYLDFDNDAKSMCLYCAGPSDQTIVDRRKNHPVISLELQVTQFLYAALKYHIFSCKECSKQFMLDASVIRFFTDGYLPRELFPDNKTNIPITDMCLSCRQIVNEQCTYCHEYYKPENLVKCDKGDCQICSFCATVCDKCDIQQCRNDKKCIAPFSGPKTRVRAEHYCKKCKLHKSFANNSYGMTVNTDKCPHGWCHRCEIHYPNEHYQCWTDT